MNHSSSSEDSSEDLVDQCETDQNVDHAALEKAKTFSKIKEQKIEDKIKKKGNYSLRRWKQALLASFPRSFSKKLLSYYL